VANLNIILGQVFGVAQPPNGLLISHGSDSDGSAFSLGDASSDDEHGAMGQRQTAGNNDDERPRAGLLRPGAITSDGPLAEER
jgi:hypothetical protein